MKNLPNVHNFSVFVIKAFLIILPVFFLPFTYDILELNKSLLILIVSVVLLTTLAIKGAREGEFKMSIGYMTLPVALMLLSIILSFFFSSSSTYSLWGMYGFLSNTLPILLALVLLPVLISTNIEKKEDLKDTVFYLLLGIGVVFLHSLLNYFGVFSSADETSFGFLNNLNFNFFGSLDNLAVMLIIGAIMSSHFVFRFKNDLNKMIISLVVLLVTLLTTVFYFGGFISILVFSVAGASLYFYRSLFHKMAFFGLISVFVISMGMFVIKMNPSISNQIGIKNREISKATKIDFKSSWAVTNSVIGSRLPFGSGIGTFSSDYSAFKPRSVNNTNAWDAVFVKPSSFYLLVLAEMGLVGFLSILFFVFKFLTHGIGKNSELSLKLTKGEIDPALADLSISKVAVLVFIISLVFTPGNSFILGMFFALVGLVLALEKINNTGKVLHRKIGFAIASDSKDREVSSLVISGYSVIQLNVLVVLLSIASIISSGIYTYIVFASDAAYRSYFNSPTNLVEVRDAYRKAASINKYNDSYQRAIIQVNSQIAQFLAQQNNENKELTEEQKKSNITDIQTLLTEATSRADFITNGSDMGINQANWEVRGQLHQSLVGLNENSKVTALQSYNVASSLDPLNPRIIATLGSVYYGAEEYDQARQIFERAVILKPDYAAARYNLANALEKLEKYKEAYDIARTIPDLLESDTDDYKKVNEYIDLLDKKVKEMAEKAAVESSAKEDLGLNTPQSPTTQPGLSNPSQPLDKDNDSSTIVPTKDESDESTVSPN